MVKSTDEGRCHTDKVRPNRWILFVIGVGVGAMGRSAWVATAGADVETPPQERSSVSMGIVRVLEVMGQFEKARDLGAILNEQKMQLDAEMEKRQEVLTRRMRELQHFQPGSDQRVSLEEEVVRLQIDFEVSSRLRASELDRQRRVWLDRIYQQVCQTASEIGRRRGLAAVFGARTAQLEGAEVADMMRQIVSREVIYNDASIDLTDELLRRLQDDYANEGGAAALRAKLDPLSGS